jgi:hypothetical protein
MTSNDAEASATTCPSCGTHGSGRYCAECAAPLRDASCGACAGPLVAGAQFCHHCGAALKAGQRVAQAVPGAGLKNSLRSHALSWAVGTAAFIALAAFVVTQRSVEAKANGDVALAPPAALGGGTPEMGGAPDISAMSPRERAERLYDRAMMAKQAGKLDSATFFATMATMAYGQLDELTLDDRYDLGRLGLLAGTVPLASAEADTILAARPKHLLGLMLAEDAARASGNASKAAAAHAKLLSSAASEQKAALPEYRLHAAELAVALGSAFAGAPDTAAATR